MAEESVNPVLKEIIRTLRDNVTEFKSKDREKIWEVRPLYATKSKDNYASILYVAESLDNKTSEITSLIVKVMHDEQYVREFQNSDKQFYNECNMFSNVVPLLKRYSGLKEGYSLFPKCYYTDDDPEKAVIIMENLQEQGYVLGDLSFDYLHCKLALEGLARFHALSYSLKHKYRDIFKTKVVDNIKEARFCNNNRKRQDIFMGYTSLHPVNVIRRSEDPELIKFREKNENFLKKLEDAFENTVDLLERLIKPKEPLAVLCHGDYNRNNIMFSYVNNKPSTVKLLDFQTIRYANPSTDITFLIYMNTSSETRRQHLDDLLATYQKTLVKSLTETTEMCRDELDQIYGIEVIKKDFERHALFGFVISSMFLHFMMATVDEIIEIQSNESNETDKDIPTEEFLKHSVQLGGHEATQRSVDVIQEMSLMKYCFDY